MNNENVKEDMALVSTFKLGNVNHPRYSRIVQDITSLLKPSKPACGQFLDGRQSGNLK